MIFVKEHPAAGTVCAKQLICKSINHGYLLHEASSRKEGNNIPHMMVSEKSLEQ